MKKVKVEITSIIKQEGHVEHFKCTGCGTLSCENDTYRIEYMEKNQSVEIPVKLLYKTDELIMQRGTIENNNYNMMKFMANEKKNCRLIAAGKIMDLTSFTKSINFLKKNANNIQLKVEYQLFSDIYLIGDYKISIDCFEDTQS